MKIAIVFREAKDSFNLTLDAIFGSYHKSEKKLFFEGIFIRIWMDLFMGFFLLINSHSRFHFAPLNDQVLIENYRYCS